MVVGVRMGLVVAVVRPGSDSVAEWLLIQMPSDAFWRTVQSRGQLTSEWVKVVDIRKEA